MRAVGCQVEVADNTTTRWWITYKAEDGGGGEIFLGEQMMRNHGPFQLSQQYGNITQLVALHEI